MFAQRFVLSGGTVDGEVPEAEQMARYAQDRRVTVAPRSEIRFSRKPV
ncbi:MAG: hypothetical protein U0P48_02305 [Ancrocorticia sp.]